MKLVIHDLSQEKFQRLFPELERDSHVVCETGKIAPCVGCFGCWIKTPGQCVRKDGCGDLGRIMAKCTEYIIISQVTYGGFSPFVKNVLDRNIGYLLPFFQIRKGKMHHAPRYSNRLRITVLGYGNDVTPEEERTFRSIAEANSVNLNALESRVFLEQAPEALSGIASEQWGPVRAGS